MVDKEEVEQSFWSYYQDMWKVAEKQHTPIRMGLRALATDRDWEVKVFQLVVGQRLVKEKELLETFKMFGIGKEDGKKIIHRLGYTLLNEHEKLFGSYWRHTFGPPSSLSHLLGKGISTIGPCLPVPPGGLGEWEQIKQRASSRR